MRASISKIVWVAMSCLLLLMGCNAKPNNTARQDTTPPIQAAQIPGDLTYQDVLQKGEYVTAVGMSPSEPRIWLGTHTGLYLSANAELWTLLSEQLAEDAVTGWVIDPKRPEFIVVGTSSGSKQSTDGGKTWRQVGSGLPDQPNMNLLTGGRAANQLQLFAHVREEGIYQSDDDGKTWRKWADLEQAVTAMLYLPKQQVLYVVTQDSLLHTDDGQWEREEIPGVQQIYSLGADRTEGLLYAATDQGVFCKDAEGWRLLEAQTPEKLIMLGAGWGEYRLVAVGESAYLYTLHNGSWKKWESS
ncbi:hypothetical protein LOK74_00250 [Brevibacillus humidisoli]|uniref:WD40/YVTN/BNR-like repeat-containing protein n=1 Tax=Brevibacillus humidisoli TaxID=2895522 RepID=UPI001E59AF6A|nr:hypothetical protein [Brevibacillus humidisoli]UFJ41033.1 hypothetical protein LOK74_00250 [Brevibacillus humidisoli]